MKILVISDLSGGYSITLPERHLYKGLAEKGAELTIISHWPTPETHEMENSGLKVIYLPIIRKIDLRVVKELRRIIIQGGYDILYITYGKALTNCLLAVRNLKVKIVGYIGSLNIHWHDPTAYLSFLNRRIDRMVCLSNAVKEHFVRQRGESFRDKCVVIYKGYNPEWINVTRKLVRADLSIPDDSLIVCCIANVRRIKGIPYLIKSADYLPLNLPVYFVLIGKGMDAPGLMKLIRKSSYRDNFRVFGFTRDVFPYTDLCDLYIQPSITEGLGRSIIEAMCLRKPVIVTDSGGASDLVDNGVNGFIVPVKSPAAIAEKILWCFENRDKLKGMGQKSLDKVRDILDPNNTVELTYSLFKEVLAEK